MKTIINKTYQSFRRAYWKVRGFRNLLLLGQSLKLDFSSNILLSWKDLLLKGNWKKNIVNHADNMQMYSLCETVNKSQEHTVIVDIGAYHGIYAILLGSLIKEKKGKVLAIEPIPSNSDILRKNVHLNKLEDVVIIEETAVGINSGTVKMSYDDSESVLSNNPADQLYVPIARLDDLLEKNNLDHVDVLIIDVEGAELLVLQSFPWDKMAVPYIMCEMHPYNWKTFGYSGKDLIEFLKQHHLKCIDMYFQVYTEFTGLDYIGPCFLLPV